MSKTELIRKLLELLLQGCLIDIQDTGKKQMPGTLFGTLGTIIAKNSAKDGAAYLLLHFNALFEVCSRKSTKNLYFH